MCKKNRINWPGEVAAILVRIEHGRVSDARQMAETLIKDTPAHKKAREEYKAEFGPDLYGFDVISYDEWVRDYQPEMENENTVRLYNDTDETFISAQAHQHLVWTLCEEDGVEYIQAGARVVNRLGYYVTAKPWPSVNLQVQWDENDPASTFTYQDWLKHYQPEMEGDNPKLFDPKDSHLCEVSMRTVWALYEDNGQQFLESDFRGDAIGYFVCKNLWPDSEIQVELPQGKE